MAACEFFVLTRRGDRLIYYNLRHETPEGTPEIFHRAFQFWGSTEPPPVFDVDGIHFMYITRNRFRFVFSTLYNVSATFYLELLSKVSSIISDSIGGITENGLKQNSTHIYEILEEIIDNGYVQSTSKEVIERNIFVQPTHKTNDFINTIHAIADPSTEVKNIDENVAMSEDLFVEVFDRVFMIMDAKGGVVSSSVEGSISIQNGLSENPQVDIRLKKNIIVGERPKTSKTQSSSSTDIPSSSSEAVKPEDAPCYFNDMNYHHCININRFEQDRVLSFVGQKGSFIALNYRTTFAFNPPISVRPIVNWINEFKLEVIVKISTHFDSKIYSEGLFVSYKCPPHTSSVKCEVGDESEQNEIAEYNESTNTVNWLIEELPGQSTNYLRALISLYQSSTPAIVKQMGPISLSFAIHNCTISGIMVEGIDVRYNRSPEMEDYYEKPNIQLTQIIETSSYICRL